MPPGITCEREGPTMTNHGDVTVTMHRDLWRVAALHLRQPNGVTLNGIADRIETALVPTCEVCGATPAELPGMCADFHRHDFCADCAGSGAAVDHMELCTG